MSADTTATKRPRRTLAPVALLFAANAATQFAIQAWLAYGFADKVWKLRGPLPYLAPVALDVFAINLMAAAYMLRRAPLRQRAYVWFWLAVVIGAQVGASEGFADHEKWTVWGRVASVFPAVFLAASLHALIIVARRRDDAAVEPTDPRPGLRARWAVWRARRTTGRGLVAGGDALAQALAGRPSPALATAHAVASRPRAVARIEVPPPPPPPVRSAPAARPVEMPEPPPPEAPSVLTPAQRAHAEQVGQRAAREVGRESRANGHRERVSRRNPHWSAVIARCLDSDAPEEAKTVALALGLNPRTAQLWVSKERERRALTSRSATGDAPAGGEKLPVSANGSRRAGT
jgi:hypothetical protein